MIYVSNHSISNCEDCENNILALDDVLQDDEIDSPENSAPL